MSGRRFTRNIRPLDISDYFPRSVKMAACSHDDVSEEDTDTTDPLSDSFDPYKALYSPTVKLPIPTAKQFNNVAEFENFLTNKDAKSQVQKKKEPLPGIIAERAAMQAREAVRKAAIMSKSEGPVEKSNTQQRKQRSTNVLTNMQRYEKGPLSILRRCVTERLRVVVVVRAAVSVRSHCRGYIIAFDKHMNMALMDVDEKYIKPLVKKPEEKERRKGNSNQASVRNPNQPLGGVDPNEEANHRLSESTSSYGIPEFKDLRDKLRSKGRNTSQFHDKQAMSDSDTKTDTTEQSVGHTQTKSQSDSEAIVRHSQKSGEQDAAEKQEQKKHYTAFWPLYKQWTENRCYATYEIISRHVNQLFVRGDNVVSVAIAK